MSYFEFDMTAAQRNADSCPYGCPWLGERIDGWMSCIVHRRERPPNILEAAHSRGNHTLAEVV